MTRFIPRPLRACAALLGAALLLSCSDATGPATSGPATLAPEVGSLMFTYLGQQRGVSVEVRDAAGGIISSPAMTWTSDDEGVVTVAAGLVTAVGSGSTTIRAAAGSASTTVAVDVRQVAAEVSLSQTSWSFTSLGDTLRLATTALDSGGSRIPAHTPEWTSLDPMVVTVSAAGLMTAVANGSAVVSAAVDGVLSSSRITVDQEPGAVSLPEDSVHFASLGDTTTVVPDIRDGRGSPIAGAEMNWTSQDESVATVSSMGRITAVGNGTTRISVTAGLQEAEVAVGVLQEVASIEVQPDSVVLRDPGDEGVAVALARDSRDNVVSAPSLLWQSGDPSVVTVATDGTITGAGTGTTWVYVSSGLVSDSVVARVEPELVLVALGDTGPSAVVDTELSLSARVEDVLGGAYGGAEVEWTVDAGSGSIVSASNTESDGTGHVGAVWKLGTTSGTQQAHGSLESRGSTVSVTFTANAQAGPAVTAALTADTVLLSARGETAFLAPAYFDAFGNVTAGSGASWVSRDPGAVTAATDGLITGMAEGTTWVVASLSSTAVDSVEVTVEMRGAITVTFDDGWLSVYDNAWPVMQALDLPANVAVYTEAASGFPAYMNETHLDELHSAGWAMVAHTVSHDTLTELSTGELDFELRAGQQWLDARGYRGSNILVAPYHEFADREKTAAASYYTAARGYSANTVTPDSIVSWMPDRPFDLTGIEADGLPYTTVAGRDRLRDLLQRTLDDGAFIDVFFHQIPVVNAADFQAVMDVVNEFRERVLPYDRLYPVWARAVY